MSKVELYTWAHCPYCINAKNLLKEKNIPYTEYPIDDQPEKKEELFAKTGQDTVPYIFIDGKLIGGYSDLKQLAEAGELDKLVP